MTSAAMATSIETTETFSKTNSVKVTVFDDVSTSITALYNSQTFEAVPGEIKVVIQHAIKGYLDALEKTNGAKPVRYSITGKFNSKTFKAVSWSKPFRTVSESSCALKLRFQRFCQTDGGTPTQFQKIEV
jgi:hypothetical protein